ncbi:hypothetical protein P154DRAFT_605618 [Amniculicola lignicola CBS 123094]|uniref:DUF7730 domain-containing protein n=1 Tax=Amniculicola lignicola CBS 123094 TaxID=1392246 RepID=A0A6A5W7V2_9PLEO|nr:hypothetical protein P154DRAFT_605618 [Amniculicola lignicola CBS 123094]
MTSSAPAIPACAPTIPESPRLESFVPKVRRSENGMLDATPFGPYVAIAERNLKASSFLCLPGEIRNQIFGYVLAGNRFSFFRTWDYTDPSETESESAHLVETHFTINEIIMRDSFEQYREPSVSLLLVCRQVYSEAARMPLMLSYFSLDSMGDLKRFKLKFFSDWQWRAITSLKICIYNDSKYIQSALDNASELIDYSGLKEIILKLPFPFIASGDWSEIDEAAAESLRNAKLVKEELERVCDTRVKVVIDDSQLE